MNPVEYRLPAEWEPQSALLLAWPAESGDWAPVLSAIRAEYCGLIRTVLRFQPVVLLVPPDDRSSLEMLDTPADLERIELRYNDTWIRDYGPITLTHAGRRLALDFHFNGWGGRFDARFDNRVNRLLARHRLFEKLVFRQSLFELEGGAIESDGAGTLMINRHCQRTRAPHLEDSEVDFELKSWLNIDHLIEIDMPPMPGDDTDGHIDTLARFAGRDSIVFQTLREAAATRRLIGQLESARDRDGRPYRLTALPAPADLDPALAASYANFILINKAVLVPRYGSCHDEEARQILAALFPERDAVAVDAATLVTQGGGPHCASMQIPASLK
ncbi:MAG: agmatine deiminase [Gammaproteobacteria bacterium HGW-Gammaproteobacteria-8]|nr:MAG: agmatine deiminase [Gammaproteobacteria bacterium HGW-Gammaproteobacteria-8]